MTRDDDGGPAAWETVFRRSYPSVYRALVAVLLDADLAEDALQEAFAEGLRRPPASDHALAGWLFRVALRRARRIRGFGLPLRLDELIGSLREPDIPAQTETLLDRLQVGDLLRLLTRRQRAVVVGSLGAGQAVRAVRDWVETQRVATGFVAGNDYVYLSDGDAANQYVQIVAMPSGQSVGRLAGQTYVGTNVEGSLMSVSGDFAYLPVARSAGIPADELNTYLQQIDLRRGIPLGRIGIGFVNPPRVALIEPL